MAAEKITPVGAASWVDPNAEVAELRRAAAECRGCELWEPATQVVFSAGNDHAPMMLVGEQPGDQEDQQGIPFVGPAGQLLQRALAEAGIDRSQVYVTNAVKHFRFELRGKRRIHATPQVSHIKACKPWLEAEVARVGPTADRGPRRDRGQGDDGLRLQDHPATRATVDGDRSGLRTCR